MSDVAAPAAAAPSAASSTAAPTDNSASSTPASATATPTPSGDGSVAPASTDPGPIPYARFKEVNDQLKAAKDFRERFGWAEEFTGNPYPYLEQWIDQVSGHPEMGPKLLAKAARMLQSRRGQQAPPAMEEPNPDVPVMDAQGNIVSQTYSASQLKKWQEWNWQQREAALSERLQPLESLKAQIEQQQQQARVNAQSEQHATSTLSRLRASQHFTQHEPAFKQYFAEHTEYGDNVDAAWWDFFNASVLPTFSQREQAKVLDHLKTQANGGTVSPAQSAPTQTPKFKDFGEALRYFSEHPEEAAVMAKR